MNGINVFGQQFEIRGKLFGSKSRRWSLSRFVGRQTLCKPIYVLAFFKGLFQFKTEIRFYLSIWHDQVNSLRRIDFFEDIPPKSSDKQHDHRPECYPD